MKLPVRVWSTAITQPQNCACCRDRYGPVPCYMHTVGRCAVGAINDTPVEFKVELKEPEPKPFPSLHVGAGAFILERSTLVLRTRSRSR